ncbi:hypothetical protein KBD34_05750 [Patescibacteria group bacterium]|nr:hypothetical protein [Patescibacteria group bacterium]
MPSRTPLFDTALQQTLHELQPGKRICPESGQPWELSVEDIARSRNLQTPPSLLAPSVRLLHMRVFMGGPDFYLRKTGAQSLITSYDPESPLSLLSPADWNIQQLNDGFFAYARMVDLDRSFFDQWYEFSLSVPRPALLQDGKSENSDWSAYCATVKNEYYGYSSFAGENCLYCEYGYLDKNCCDVTGSDRVEWSYDSVRCDDSSQLVWCERCTQSVNLIFCLNCDNCQDCFGSTNLRGKKNYFLNQPLSTEEYKKKISEIDLGDATIVAYWKKRIQEEYWNTADRRALTLKSCEHCTGDDLIECKDTTGVSLGNSERLYDSFGTAQAKDCTSLVSSVSTERCHYSQNIFGGYEVRFSSFCTACLDVEYSELLTNCEHCFGCIGLTNKKFCIFNKQYTEEDYWKTVDLLKTKMLERGEYGEFFPYASAFIAYNSSNADIFFPLTKQEIERRGARWFDFAQHQALNPSSQTISVLPTKLADTTDAVLTQTFACEKSGRLYRIVKPELEWHRKFNLALPRLHPTIRRKQRSEEMYPLNFCAVTCPECGTSTETRIPLSRGYRILCETCYCRKQVET